MRLTMEKIYLTTCFSKTPCWDALPYRIIVDKDWETVAAIVQRYCNLYRINARMASTSVYGVINPYLLSGSYFNPKS